MLETPPFLAPFQAQKTEAIRSYMLNGVEGRHKRTPCQSTKRLAGNAPQPMEMSRCRAQQRCIPQPILYCAVALIPNEESEYMVSKTVVEILPNPNKKELYCQKIIVLHMRIHDLTEPPFNRRDTKSFDNLL